MNNTGGTTYNQTYGTNKVSLPKEFEFVNPDDEEVKCKQFKNRLIDF